MAVQMEQTLALIKPDALQYSEDIKDIIRKENFTIIKVSCHRRFINILYDSNFIPTKFVLSRKEDFG